MCRVGRELAMVGEDGKVGWALEYCAEEGGLQFKDNEEPLNLRTMVCRGEVTTHTPGDSRPFGRSAHTYTPHQPSSPCASGIL